MDFEGYNSPLRQRLLTAFRGLTVSHSFASFCVFDTLSCHPEVDHPSSDFVSAS